MCKSIIDFAISNYNRLFWLKKYKVEGVRLWEIGKHLGVMFFEKEE